MSGRPKPRAIAQELTAVALVVVATVLLRRAGVLPPEAGPLLALGFLVVAGAVGGSLAALCGLPRLTGNLVAGILAGPHGFALLGSSDVKSLALINTLALALIALQAGAELTLPTLQRVWRGITASIVAQTIIVIPITGLTFFVARRYVPFLADLPVATVGALAVLWGAISFCRSPSVTVAVIAETKAKGPLTDWVLGVTVLGDVVLLPLFAGALMIARARVLEAPVEPAELLRLGRDLFASFAAGVTFGLVIAVLFRFTRERILVVVVVAYFVTAMCDFLGYDTLFTFVAAGFVVTNLTPYGHALVNASERTSAGVMVVFFATAGAGLDVGALAHLWPVAIAFVVVRLAATWLSAQVGHRVARDPPAVRSGGWLGLVSQSGVTIGLVLVAAQQLPSIGAPLTALAVAVVAINVFGGAVLTKLALQRAGEIPMRAPASAAAE